MIRPAILVYSLSIVFAASAIGSDELARRATWAPPTTEAVQEQVAEWFSSREPSSEQRTKFESLWGKSNDGASKPNEVLAAVVGSVAVIDSNTNKFLNALQTTSQLSPELQVAVLKNEQLPDWAKTNLRLWYAQWLADHQYYNELREQIEQIEPNEVADPAALLFYQSVAYHRLLDKEKCLPTLDKLLENESSIPKRYATLAKLMKADIEPLKEDSLDEVARLMDSIKVRLGHGRAGTRVRKEEDDVIAKLDKMIEQLEQQAQQSSSSQSSGGQNGGAPSAPMQDSMPAQARGAGNVDPKKLGAQTDWGNLPAKEREEALQQLGKDLPSHYRDVIEEYFQKLAKDGVQP